MLEVSTTFCSKQTSQPSKLIDCLKRVTDELEDGESSLASVNAMIKESRALVAEEESAGQQRILQAQYVARTRYESEMACLNALNHIHAILLSRRNNRGA